MERISLSGAGQRRGLWQVALAGTLWGTIGPATQIIFGLASTTPLSISFFRAVFATPILLVICWWLLGTKTFQFSRGTFGLMVLIGMLTGISQTSYFIAIPLAGVTISTLIAVCIAPVSVALVSVVLRLEPFNLKVMLALGLALIGTVLVVGIEPGTSLPQNALTGVVFSIVSGLTYAGAIVSGRRVANRAHPLQINMISFATSGIMLLIAGLVTNGLRLVYPLEGWLLLLYLATIPTVMGYGLFMAGMKTTPATIAGIITLLEPVTAAFLAALFFGERLTAVGVLGSVLLLGAILVLARSD